MAVPCHAVSASKDCGVWIQLRLQAGWPQAHGPMFTEVLADDG